MSDTPPRTYAALIASQGQWSYEMRDLCVELERENAAMREAIKEAHASIEHLIDIASGGMRPANGPMIAIRNGHKTLSKLQPFLKP